MCLLLQSKQWYFVNINFNDDFTGFFIKELREGVDTAHLIW